MTALLFSRGFGALGFQILTVWMAFQIYRVTGSYVAVGGLGLSFFLANVAAAAVSGYLVDHWLRRSFRSLFLLQLGLAVGAAAVFVFLAEHPEALLLAGAALTFLRQLRSILYAKSLSTLVAGGVSTARVAKWNTFSWQLALLVGPLLFSRTAGYVFLAPALATAFLATAAFFVPPDRDAEETTSPPPRVGWTTHLLAGWRTLRAEPLVFRAWIYDAGVTLFVGAIALFPFLLARGGYPAEELGTLRAALALGALLVSGLIPHAWIHDSGRNLFVISLVGVGVATGLYAHAPTFVALVFLLILTGALDGVSVIVRDEWFFRHIPRERVGSAAAVTSLLISTADDLGEFESGIAAQYLGLSRTLALGAGISILAGLVFALQGAKVRRCP